MDIASWKKVTYIIAGPDSRSWAAGEELCIWPCGNIKAIVPSILKIDREVVVSCNRLCDRFTDIKDVLLELIVHPSNRVPAERLGPIRRVRRSQIRS